LAYDWKTELPGVFSRHADDCPVRDGGEDTCGPLGYRASVRDWQTNRRTISPLFATAQEALAWQRDQTASRDASRNLASERSQVGAVIDEFLQSAENELAWDGGSERYTRESVRQLRGALSYVDSELGTMGVQDVRRRHVQALLEQLRASGLPAPRVIAVAEAVKELYAYAIRRELVGFSPAVELDLPTSENGTAHAVPMPPKEHAEAPAAAGSTSGELYAAPPAVGDPWTPPPFTPSGPDPAMPTGDPTGAIAPPGYPPPSYPTSGFPADAPPTGTYPTGAYPPQGYPPQGYPSWTYPPQGYPPGYATPTAYPAQPQPTNSVGTGSLTSAIFGSPGNNTEADYDSTMQERWLWWTVRIIVIVFVLIALVLVAESV
jgi:hypothetical protein